MYKYAFFDLDGTLTDSRPGILNCVIYALDYYKIPYTSRESLNFFIGPPLLESFMNYCHFDEKKGLEAVMKFRERYNPIGVYENSAFEGIHEVLKELKDAGVILGVATSKPHHLMLRVLEKYGLKEYFKAVEGSKTDSLTYRKSMVVREVLADFNVPKEDYSKVIMVGDRYHDIEAAKECGLASMGVLYGYGTREEFDTYGADYIAECVEDVAKIILN